MRSFAKFWMLASALPALLFARDQALRLGDGLVQMGNYRAAITEYERFICFSSDSNAAGDAWMRVARCYGELEQWNDALNAVHKSVGTIRNDSLREEGRIEGAVLLIAGRQYSAAEVELLRLGTFSKHPAIERRASFFLGVCDLYTHKWDEARKAFAASFDGAQARERGRLDSLLAPRRRPRPRSPELAQWLSTFLPGAGQIYAGDWRNGLNALAINGATGYLLVSSLIAGNFGDAILSYLGLFQRYYLGNRQRAEMIARERNHAQDKQYQKMVLEAVERGLD